jgi:VIT1/CCC1 family predicted Fe2+/Mn2+ transporter
VPATHEVLVIAATASVIAAVAWSAFGIARFSGQSWVPRWYRNTLAALFCTLPPLVAAVVVAVYIEDRQY